MDSNFVQNPQISRSWNLAETCQIPQSVQEFVPHVKKTQNWPVSNQNPGFPAGNNFHLRNTNTNTVLTHNTEHLK